MALLVTGRCRHSPQRRPWQGRAATCTRGGTRSATGLGRAQKRRPRAAGDDPMLHAPRAANE